MCLIIACKTSLPPLDTLEDGEQANPDGGGVMWTHQGLTRWEKNLSAKEIHRRISPDKLPLAIHFRLATVGGKCRELNHPFPLLGGVPLYRRGLCHAAMMHNGHWDSFEKVRREIETETKVRPLTGAVSDSRILAWLAFLAGDKTFSLLEKYQRIALLRRGRLRLFGDWQERGGYSLSNTFHESWTSARAYKDDVYKALKDLERMDSCGHREGYIADRGLEDWRAPYD